MFQQLNQDQFDAEVKQSAIPAIVDFTATWCGPCKMLAPTIEKLAKNYEGRVKVYSVDVDNARTLATTLGIRGVPTVIFFKDGIEKDRVSGNVPYDNLAKKLDTLL
jgi:thioredoxin 1